MNTNPNATTILCFGDSNTYGQKPDKTGRYDADVRWTGVLQGLLGNDFRIIEEGLSSRTTDLEYAKKPGRNGKTYLAPALHSHNPLDIIVIMLGTNDLKIEYSRTADAIASALDGLIDDIFMYAQAKDGATSEIILVSPIEIEDTALRFAEFYSTSYDSRSATESRKLPEAIKKVADQRGVSFLDAALVSKPGVDGVHFSEESEYSLAELLASTIKGL